LRTCRTLLGFLFCTALAERLRVPVVGAQAHSPEALQSHIIPECFINARERGSPSLPLAKDEGVRSQFASSHCVPTSKNSSSFSGELQVTSGKDFDEK
jgi:hypothetical protein